MTFETFLLILLVVDLVATFCFWKENRRLKEENELLKKENKDLNDHISIQQNSLEFGKNLVEGYKKLYNECKENKEQIIDSCLLCGEDPTTPKCQFKCNPISLLNKELSKIKKD